jgi:hypothetical protein
MNRIFVFVLLTAMTALGTEIPSSSLTSDQAKAVTFNKDVLPILQNNCQVCHRTGEVAPMSFLTYEGTRPWAKAIKAAVVTKKMPPWFADPHDGEFRNAPKLTEKDIQTLSAWADNGAREGDAADKLPAIQWANGWRIQPDVVVSMPVNQLVADKGRGEVMEYFVENPFKEDTWVSSIEIRPGDPSVVHHAIVQIPESNPARRVVLETAPVGVRGAEGLAAVRKELQQALVQKVDSEARLVSFLGQFGQRGGDGGNSAPSTYNDQFVRNRERQTGEGAFMTMEAVYAPGTSPLDFRFSDSARLVKAGLPIRIEVHYQPNGKETRDQTQIGFTLAKSPAQRRFVIMAPEHLVDSRKPIPPGESNYETRGEITFKQDAELVWFMPHMHLRGKDMSFRLYYPDGREQTVLNAKFNFNWQLGYEVKEPIKVPQGTRMVVTAHHDNSANNPFNPAPDSAVPWGDLTHQEMMLPWFGVVVDKDVQPEMIATYRPGDLDGLALPARGVGIRGGNIGAPIRVPAQLDVIAPRPAAPVILNQQEPR